MFSLSVKDTIQATYSWYKVGSETILGATNLLTFTAATISDSGNYYCIVSNPLGKCTSKTAHFSVRSSKPVASFVIVPKQGPVPLNVTFTDASTGNITSRLWKFGDDRSSTEINPTHEYIKPGLYTVVLITNGPQGSDTLVKTDSIYAYAGNVNPVNSIVISKLYFDSQTSSIRISFSIDSAALVNNPEVGITYSLSQFPTTPTGNSTISISSRSTDTIVPLNENTSLGATYYVALWFRLQNGAWIEPTVASKKSLMIGLVTPYREIIKFFDSSTVSNIVTAFGKKIFLWKDSSYTGTTSTTDSLETSSFVTFPAGLVPVGLPFFFRSGGSVHPLYIGIHIDSLLKGTSLSDVRIYNNKAGKFYVNYTSMIDSVNNIVYIKTNNLDGSFIPMLDTIAPKVTFYSNTTLPVMAKTELKDVVSIIDNIANVRWKYLYGSGNQLPTLHREGIIDSAGTILTFIIPDTDAAISSESGLRILLVIEDGRHIDTINISRSV